MEDALTAMVTAAMISPSTQVPVEDRPTIPLRQLLSDQVSSLQWIHPKTLLNFLSLQDILIPPAARLAPSFMVKAIVVEIGRDVSLRFLAVVNVDGTLSPLAEVTWL